MNIVAGGLIPVLLLEIRQFFPPNQNLGQSNLLHTQQKLVIKSQKAGGAQFGCPSASIISGSSGSWVVKFYLWIPRAEY